VRPVKTAASLCDALMKYLGTVRNASRRAVRKDADRSRRLHDLRLGLLIVAAASARAPISLIREAWVPIRIGGIATVPSAKRICQTFRAREGQDPRWNGISIGGPHLA
jgi:hypothetical protein